jgi:hypothetical protein
MRMLQRGRARKQRPLRETALAMLRHPPSRLLRREARVQLLDLLIPCRSRQLASIALVLASTLMAMASASALASTQQEALFQDNGALASNPNGTLQQLRLLGVGRVRVAVHWMLIAPSPGSRRRPHGFNATNPAAYPKRNWTVLDEIVRDAQAQKVMINFNVVGGAPKWATGPGEPRDNRNFNWEPSSREFGSFVRALGIRYSGNYDPRTKSVRPGNAGDLPAVRQWSIWNEPDYGPSLAPQGIPGNLGIEKSPSMYRSVLDAAWTALHATGHGHDTFLFGELAPRGYDNFGLFSGMKPLRFLRVMYCVDSRYHELRGAAAAIRGCPTTAAGSSRFRSAHPALFGASGIAVHPYSRWYPPNVEAQPDPDYSTLAELPSFERGLDRLQRVYGSRTRLSIWNTEYGYLTSPPKRTAKGMQFISQATAAYYMNWAEYISWRDPRVATTMQYLLKDPLAPLPSNAYGGFASGLLNFNGRPKAGYYAYRLPLYLPVTSARSGQSIEVWGCARPAYYASIDTGGQPQNVEIQFQPASGGAFTTVKTMTITDPHGYFDTRVSFPSSGTVRLTWSYPPSATDLLPYRVYSRHVQITVH